jgi:hypothetical protein
MKSLRLIILSVILLAGSLLSGCGSPAFSIQKAMPAADAVSGWNAPEAPLTYDKDTIFQLMDGQAEFFFRYGFEKVVTNRFQNADGTGLEVEIWQLATSADAYGLFTVNDGGSPIRVGKANDANLEDQNKLVFWQNRYYVLLRPESSIPNADLQQFAETVSAALPTGGAKPAIMGKLPSDGLVAQSEIFFHEEISIQNKLWLGGENILGLSPRTDGVLADYTLGGNDAQLLIVQYPAGTDAAAALTALQGASVEGYLAGQTSGNYLAAVFGTADPATAAQLLTLALNGAS